MRSCKQIIAVSAVSFAGMLGAAPASASELAGKDFVPGEVIVSFKGEGERLLKLPDRIAVGEAARALRANRAVAFANPNFIARASMVPNDPGPSGRPGGWRHVQWNFLPCGSSCGLDDEQLEFESPGGINAIDAWRTIRQRGRASGRGVRVAVLDTGVAYRHWRGRFRKSPDFHRGQFLRGWDFVARNKHPLDRDGHGTHVTGTIAERNNNGIALTGLAPAARIIPVRVLDAQGLGTARAIARGIRFAAQRGARVINMSFEFSSAVNSCARIRAVCRALRFATLKRGAVVVAAAGNSNGPRVAFPARAPRVLGVGRTTRDGCVAFGSRGGEGLDLVAPGGGTPRVVDCRSDLKPDLSTPIFQLTLRRFRFKRFGYPKVYEGTSMAAAHVSGVAAMVISSGVLGPKPPRVAIECQLQATARNQDFELGQRYEPSLFGAGLLDAARAVEARAPAC